MKRHPVLLLLVLAACTGDSDPVGDLAGTGLEEPRPLSGRWVGSATTGEAIDVSLTEILRDVGGMGTIVRDGQTLPVAVEGRHEGGDVGLRFSSPGEGWDFTGTVRGVEVTEIQGRWTTLQGSADVFLARCGTSVQGC